MPHTTAKEMEEASIREMMTELSISEEEARQRMAEFKRKYFTDRERIYTFLKEHNPSISGMEQEESYRRKIASLMAEMQISETTAAALVSWKPIYKTRTPRFAEEVKKVADPSELQRWAVATLQETLQASSSHEIPRDKVPVGIRNLTSDGSPFQNAFCDAGSVQDRTVWLVWGGGFGHWGIRIGTSSFRVSSDDNYYIEWKPGLYFWHQTH